MQNLYMYMCDTCGFSKDRPDRCPNCEIVLTMYTKDTQDEYQVDMEEAMRMMSEYKWYV